MSTQRRNGLWLLISLACLTPGGRGASAPGCALSPILFTLSGSLYAMQSANTTTQIAQGFKEPYDLTWAPNCAHYALIDWGSLWMGTAGQPPVQVAIPWQVLEYLWSPGGDTIAAVVARPTAFASQSLVPPGDLITLSPGTKGWRLLTEDGKNRLLGWSDDSTSLLIQKEVSAPCDPRAHECATGDVVILDLSSGLQTALLTAKKLNADGWSDPDFLGWEARKGVLYIESQVVPIGGISVVAALRVPSAEILWKVDESYGAHYLGDGLVATNDRQPQDYDETGRNWSHKYEIIRGGKVVTEFPAIPSDLVESAGPVSPDGKYVLWDVPDNDHLIWRIHFATTATASAWSFELRRGYEPIGIVWTPWDVAIVGSYCKGPRDEWLFDLSTLDPQKKETRSFYQAKLALGAGWDPEILGLTGAVRGPDGRLHHRHPILDVARWAR